MKNIVQVRSNRQSQMRLHGKIFTLLELLVVISIIVILMSLLLPALKKSRGTAQQIKCCGNLKQIGIGMAAYCNDYSDYLPMAWTGITPDSDWARILRYHEYINCWKFDPTGSLNWCPTAATSAGTYSHYGMTINILSSQQSLKFVKLSSPGIKYSTTILISENGGNSIVSPWYDLPSDKAVAPRHSANANYLFFDLHVAWARDRFAFVWTIP